MTLKEYLNTEENSITLELNFDNENLQWSQSFRYRNLDTNISCENFVKKLVALSDEITVDYLDGDEDNNLDDAYFGTIVTFEFNGRNFEIILDIEI